MKRAALLVFSLLTTVAKGDYGCHITNSYVTSASGETNGTLKVSKIKNEPAASCQFTLEAAPNQTIFLHLSSLYVPLSSACHRGFVRLRLSSRDSSDFERILCRHDANDAEKLLDDDASYDRVNVSFFTLHREERQGFTMEYRIMRRQRADNKVASVGTKKWRCGKREDELAAAIDSVECIETCTIGNEDRPDGSWPWIGSLYDKLRSHHVCEASLISEQWLITAAHCLRKKRKDTADDVWRRWMIRLGGNDLWSEPVAHEVQRGIEDVIIHPGYVPESGANDIALIKMQTSVEFNRWIQPLCLPLQNESVDGQSELFIAGWGQNFEDLSALTFIRAYVIDEAACRKLYTSRITRNTICAGDLRHTREWCQGNSGGPLIARRGDGSFALAGVASFGQLCSMPFPSGVYTRVSNYVDWIQLSLDLH